MSTVALRHIRIDLALHELRSPTDSGRPLLLLHALGSQSPDAVPEWADSWPGAIAALDFTGHGASTVPRCGGYSPELLLADADHALAHLVGDDPDAAITVVGTGLGAYIGLQLAGARAPRVHGAILLDGPGLAGGPTGPSSHNHFHLPSDGRAPDPYALMELGRDLRPADYATSFVRLANSGSPADTPIAVCATFRPAWLAAVVDAPGVIDTTLDDALSTFA